MSGGIRKDISTIIYLRNRIINAVKSGKEISPYEEDTFIPLIIDKFKDETQGCIKFGQNLIKEMINDDILVWNGFEVKYNNNWRP